MQIIQISHQNTYDINIIKHRPSVIIFVSLSHMSVKYITTGTGTVETVRLQSSESDFSLQSQTCQTSVFRVRLVRLQSSESDFSLQSQTCQTSVFRVRLESSESDFSL
ncbi:hypothetical protein JOB18_049237 [Solea senegalensis]|uniref:Uncharacterized protein n=1 Tax=Solea senegalensis TaxID=28829 RepID=A0AAV6PYL9_SOLSE|nr:hypothetical protein JOB18_049237 [Solea senegalensis]KAG7476234.1 hypothetical protein JOB18_049237 [Solea senegalensis]